MSKHTPGPWKIRNDITKDTLICSENKTIICGIHQKNLNILSETKANAQLIAAAPELLDIAEYSLKIVENLPCECDSYNGFTCKKHEWERKLRLVINKAEGSNQDG